MSVAVHSHGPQVRTDGTVAFRLWAPHADRVALVVDGEETAMDSGAHGWFESVAPGRHGTRYAYRVDGGPPRPDPASRWQPDGVHGQSRVADPSHLPWSSDEHAWRPPVTLAQAVLYELHVGTFTEAGTFTAAESRLRHLADLGVTHVEIMPINAFNGDRGWGYDGVAWYAVHEPYGGPEAFARFVDACHRHGLAVVLDVVYNHLGPSGNYLPDFGPYQTDRYRTPWGPAMNLDGAGADPVRRFIVDNAMMWLRDYHVDALRLDAVHGLVDTSSVHVLTELATAADRLAETLGRPLELIAESDRNDPLTVTPRAEGGQGLAGQWLDDLHHGIHTAVTGEHEGYYCDYTGLEDVAAAYCGGFVFDGRYSSYRERTVGAPYGNRPAWRLVACIQNHDQVGNRAFGERLTALVAPARVRVAALLLMAAPHTPMLFMGEEYGEIRPFLYFAGHPEPELAEAVRTGRREEFAAFATFATDEVPDPVDPNTFVRSRLDWARDADPPGRARFALWRDLIAVRRHHPALHDGRLDLVDLLHQDEDVLVVRRGGDAGMLVAANLGDRQRSVEVEGSWEPLVDTNAPVYGGDGPRVRARAGSLQLPPQAAALLRQG